MTKIRKDHSLNVSEETLYSSIPPTKLNSEKLLDLAINCLDENKAVDITTIALKGKTSITDYMIIATGTSKRHAAALADYLSRELKKQGCGTPVIEGLEQADWVLLDAGDVIIHIFRPEVRSFYNIEKMWSLDIDADDKAH